MPGAENPQSWNRFSYAYNNPIKFIDPTGHYIDEGCGSGDLCELPVSEPPEGDNNHDGRRGGVPIGPGGILNGKENNPFVSCYSSSNPYDCYDDITPELIESWWQGGHSITLIENWWQGGFLTIQDLANNPSWIESMLASREMPLAMAAISVLAADGIPLAVGVTWGVGVGPIGLEDLPITLGLFAISRAAAVLGTTSTFYQYSQGINDVQSTDVAVSAVTTLAGFYPPATIGAVHVNLFYSAYRYWDSE